jgi:hypothetical protein
MSDEAVRKALREVRREGAEADLLVAMLADYSLVSNLPDAVIEACIHRLMCRLFEGSPEGVGVTVGTGRRGWQDVRVLLQRIIEHARIDSMPQGPPAPSPWARDDCEICLGRGRVTHRDGSWSGARCPGCIQRPGSLLAGITETGRSPMDYHRFIHDEVRIDLPAPEREALRTLWAVNYSEIEQAAVRLSEAARERTEAEFRTALEARHYAAADVEATRIAYSALPFPNNTVGLPLELDWNDLTPEQRTASQEGRPIPGPLPPAPPAD